MSPIEPALGAVTGWALFDWESNTTGRPTFTRIAGGMSATRLQFDRYRRYLQMVGWGSQVQLWVWSSATFGISFWYQSTGGAVTETYGPQVYPEAANLETSVTPREARFTAGGGGLFDWDAGAYHTSRTTTAAQMTIAGRFFGHYTFAQIGNGAGRRIWFSGASCVRILAIGQHNADWRSDGIS